MLDRKLLGIYLNDHLAGSTVGVELARRCRSSNKDNDSGQVLERIVREIEEDRETLKGLMDSLEIGKDRVKVSGAWVAEKFGRLKPNGRLIGYSPLSRVVELEALSLGIAGKVSLWEALREVAEQDARLDAEDLKRLADRADRQRREVWQLRQRAAREAFVAEA